MHGKPVKNHKELIKLAKEIALNKDKELKDDIKEAEKLHVNYEEFIDKEEFPRYYEAAMRAYSKLFNILLHDNN